MTDMDKRSSYNDLLLENTALRKEIAALKRQLSELSPFDLSHRPKKSAELSETKSMPPAPVHKHSNPEEKIELFMRLFAGRTDIYAKRFVNKRTGKSGYAPACGNEWIHDICHKPKVKCSKCPNRKLLPLTSQVVYSHLLGRNTLGEDVVPSSGNR